MRSIRPLFLLLSLACVWVLATLHRGLPLQWDEIEFFRATRWIGEGQVPYRDFWEHHTPLLWVLFAPCARLFGDGAGVSGVLVMRWLQVPVLCAVVALLVRFGVAAGARTWSVLSAIIFLLSSPEFVYSAVQYRLEALSALFYFAALFLVMRSDGWRAWLAFGALMSASVLVNMRMAPLVIATAVLAAWVDTERHRWRWRGQSLWAVAGIAIVAVPFLLWLHSSGAWPGFSDGVFRYNSISNAWLEDVANTFVQRLLSPVHSRDAAAIALWAGALAASLIVLKGVRRPGVTQLLAMLFAASIASVALLGIQFPYHFLLTYLLMVPLAAVSLDLVLADPDREGLWRVAVIAVAALILLIDLVPLAAPSFGAGIRYQDVVMKTVDARTTAAESVWDGCGYALRRKPAYRYWFLPSGVRYMAKKGLIEPYDFAQIASDPPAAIVYNYRIHLWMLNFPELGRYVVHHYVPLYRNLWIPGMSATVTPGGGPTVWRVPRDGTYAVWSSDLLIRHPWLARPLEYGMFEGPAAAEMEIPLRRLPASPARSLHWRVNGQPQDGPSLSLRKGDRLEVTSTLPDVTGIMVIPSGIEQICMAPEDPFLF